MFHLPKNLRISTYASLHTLLYRYTIREITDLGTEARIASFSRIISPPSYIHIRGKGCAEKNRGRMRSARLKQCQRERERQRERARTRVVITITQVALSVVLTLAKDKASAADKDSCGGAPAREINAERAIDLRAG